MALMRLTRVINYYTKDTALSTLVVYAAIKIIVLLGAILVSLRFQPSALLRNPLFLANYGGIWYMGYRVPRICL